MGNFKKRVERLEGGRKGGGFCIIPLTEGRSQEEALQKHFAKHPEDAKAEKKILNLLSRDQYSPSAPPPPRPEPQYNGQALGPGPLQITTVTGDLSILTARSSAALENSAPCD